MKRLLALLVLAGTSTFLNAVDLPVVIPLTQAHSHNDYVHARPLLDALDHGFCSIEADIHAFNGKLLVGHNVKDLKPHRTLEALYLDPLRVRVKQNGGRVYPNGPAVTLLVEFKGKPDVTYPLFKNVLHKYADVLTSVDNGRVTERAITVIAAGNIPMKELAADPDVHYCMLDGDGLKDLNSKLPASTMPSISVCWPHVSSWRGKGPMPEDQRAKVLAVVKKAHDAHRKIRFWGTSSSPAFWKELLNDGVDLVNFDDLDAGQKFLLQRNHKT